MKSILVYLLLFSAISCSSSQFIKESDLKEEIKRTTLPKQSDFPENDGVILLKKINMSMKIENDYGIATDETIHQITKLFKNIEEYANVRIPIYDGEKLLSISARTIKADGTSIELKPEDFHTVTGASNGSIFYSDVKVINFTFPSIEKDCIIEYEVKKYKEYAFRRDEWIVQDYLPIIKNRFELTVPTILMMSKMQGGLNWSWNYKNYGDIKIGQPVQVNNLNPGGGSLRETVTFYWEKFDIPAFEYDPWMPAHDLYKDYVKFSPDNWKTWNDISNWYYKELWEPQYKQSEKAVLKSKEIVKGSITEEQKIKSLYQYSQGLRYVSIALGVGGIQPTIPDLVLERQYGDCKDKSTLLIAMLRHENIKAKPVLVLTSDEGEVDPTFPTWYFNHMIVRAETSTGKVFWLDPTTSFSKLGEIRSDCEGIKVLVLNEDGTSKIETTPKSNYQENLTDIALTVDVKTDAPSVFNVKYSFKGERNSSLRNYFFDKTEKEMKEFCKRMIADDFVTAEILKYSYSPLDSIESDLVLNFDFTIPDAVQKQGDLYFLNIDPFKLATETGWLAKEKRKFPIDFEYPFSLRKTININLPEKELSIRNLPENAVISTNDFDYRVSIENKNKAISVVENYAIKNARIPAKNYDETKKFFAAVKNKLNEKVILEKKK